MDIFTLIETSTVEQVENAIDHDHQLLHETSASFGLPLLHYACTHFKLDIVSLLVQKYKVNINEKSVMGHTALQMACWGGSLKIVKYLIQNGYDTTMEHDGGIYANSSCVEIVIHLGNLELLKYLVDHGLCDMNKFLSDQSAYGILYNCLNSESSEVVKFLIGEYGANERKLFEMIEADCELNKMEKMEQKKQLEDILFEINTDRVK